MTYTEQTLQEWRRCGGVLTRPAIKAIYDRVCHGDPYFTSMRITKMLNTYGDLVGHVRPEGRGHFVQVWAIGPQKWK